MSRSIMLNTYFLATVVLFVREAMGDRSQTSAES